MAATGTGIYKEDTDENRDKLCHFIVANTDAVVELMNKARLRGSGHASYPLVLTLRIVTRPPSDLNRLSQRGAIQRASYESYL